jgi:predicted nucleic acid-binding protein
VDTNVVLDLLLAREPFVKAAVDIFCLVEASRIEACLCATTFTTIDYLLTRSLPVSDSREALGRLIRLFDIAPVNRAVIEHALSSRMEDFEDAVLAEAGCLAGATCIVTRDVKDFAQSGLKVFEPDEFLAVFKALDSEKKI